MTCKFCGAEMIENSKFCLKCGKGIGGEINPSQKEKTKQQFEQEILPICKRFSMTLDEKREVDYTYAEYMKATDALKKAENSTMPIITIPIIVTAILAAIFAVLIPGLNYDNENFHWIVKDHNVSLALCSAMAFIPFYALSTLLESVYGDSYFSFGDVIKSGVIGLVCGLVSTLIMAFFKGFFGKGFVAACIVFAVILVIVAVVLIIRWVLDSTSREVAAIRQREVENLRQEYEKKFNDAVRPYREKYKDILSKEELDKCVDNAKSAQASKDLQEITDTLEKMVKK